MTCGVRRGGRRRGIDRGVRVAVGWTMYHGRSDNRHRTRGSQVEFEMARRTTHSVIPFPLQSLRIRTRQLRNIFPCCVAGGQLAGPPGTSIVRYFHLASKIDRSSLDSSAGYGKTCQYMLQARHAQQLVSCRDWRPAQSHRLD